MSWLSEAMGSDAARNAQREGQRATQTAEGIYNETGGIRRRGLNAVTNPQSFDFSADYAGGPRYRAVSDPLLAQATGMQTRTLAGLENGPDRMAMVRQALADLDTENAPRLEAGMRRIGQRASALGRIGAQGVTTELGTLAGDMERDRGVRANELMRGAIEGDVNDRFRRADLAGNVVSQAYGRGANERGYEDSLTLGDIDRRVQQRDREMGAGDRSFEQGMGMLDFGYGLSPEAAINRQATRFQDDANRRGAQFNNFVNATGRVAAAAATGGTSEVARAGATAVR